MAKDTTLPVYQDLSRRATSVARLAVPALVTLPVVYASDFLDDTSGWIVGTNVFLGAFSINLFDDVLLLVLLVYVGFLYAVFAWTYCAARNLRALQAEGLTSSPGWAVGWYFVPIANIWQPYRVALRIWRASQTPKGTNPKLPPYLRVWFWASVVATTLPYGTNFIETVNPAQFLWQSSLIFSELIATIISVFLTIRLSRDVALAQNKYHTQEVFA